MFKLISHQRQPGQLVIELKRRFGLEMIPPLVLISLFFFLIFMALIGPLAFFLVCFGALYFFYAARSRVFLCYNAGTLRVVRYYDLGLTQWQKQSIYNRAEVPPPVVWVRVMTPGCRGEGDAPRRYETRFPFLSLKNGGVICVHPSHAKMLALRNAIDDFWAETPYDKSVYEQAMREQSVAAHVPQRTSRKTSETTRERKQNHNVTRFDETKQYAFDRGETPIRRGDEPITKGEPGVKKKRSRNKSYALRHRDMVKVEEDVSADLTRGTLKLVSTSGGIISSCLASLSMLLYYAGLLALVTGGVGFLIMQIWHWDQIERHILPYAEKIIAACPTEEMRQPVADTTEWYVKANREGRWDDMFTRGGNKTGAVLTTVVLWLTSLPVYIGVAQLVRWPFWKRWTVIIKYCNTESTETRKPFGSLGDSITYQPRQPAEIRFSWRHDRSRHQEPPKSLDLFFRVIPATPKTNRLLTGRPLVSGNRGWNQPLQVVLITAEGTFPLPCAGIDEQEQIIDRIARFADGMTRVGQSCRDRREVV